MLVKIPWFKLLKILSITKLLLLSTKESVKPDSLLDLSSEEDMFWMLKMPPKLLFQLFMETNTINLPVEN